MSYGGIPSEASTSKFPKRLTRDIYLSNDIGRDKNVDPFERRDLTKLFGDVHKLDRGATTLSYATKPPARHTPSPVDMHRSTSRANGSGGPRNQPGTICEGNYNPALPTRPVSVGFTKNVRWSEDRTPTAAVQRREVIERQRSMELEVGLQHAHVDLSPPPIIQAPDPRRAPAFSGYSGRGKKDDPSSAPVAPHERFTQFPWDARARLAKKAVQLNIPPVSTGGGGAAQGSHRNRTSSTATTTRNLAPATTSSRVGALPRGPSTHRSMTSDSFEEEDERWKAERTLLIQRMGLGGGAGKRDRKRKQNLRGADFSSTASRSAPMWHQPRGKEINDLMYQPSMRLTTHVRAHSADVRLGSYSSRNTTQQPFVETVENVLQFENLVRFHERRKRNAKLSVFALPELDDDDEAASAAKQDAAPDLSRADDFNLHPESARPPQRGLYAQTVAQSPSLFLFADRPGSSIQHVIGGARQAASSALNRHRRSHAQDGGGGDGGGTSAPSYPTQGSAPSTQ